MLIFDEKKHQYKIGDLVLTSVTRFVGRFFPPFDAKGIARKLSKFPKNKEAKKGVRFWLKEWKDAASFGTMIHNQIDHALSEKPLDEEQHELTKQALSWLEDFKATLPVKAISSERIIYSKKHDLAGTIDLLIMLEGGKIVICDWKTNKEIKTIGFKGAKAFEPINELEDCNWSKYMLQLSTYAYILESEYGYDISDLILVHLKPKSVQTYYVPYRRDIVEEMLKWEK